MFTFLIPLYYMVSKLAEEKESKSREGMKMMGLKDDAYFLSWFVFYAIIVTVMSLIILGMVNINLFPNSSKVLIFLLAFLYGITLFGFALTIVAILPTVRASATAATLIHLVTYFGVFSLRDPDIPYAMKTGMSVFPNIAMYFGIYNLYHFEANAGGMNFSNMSLLYNNTSFLSAIVMLLVDAIFYLCLGLYLDQILQSQFGVPKKWYFLFTKKFWCSGKKKGANNRNTGEY